MDYFFGAGNRYLITPFSNSGRFRIDFLTLDRPGRPEAMLEYHAAVEDDPDVVPDIEDYPYLSRFIRITDAAAGNHKIFNHQQADYFAQFNGFLSGHPGMVYDACLERCFELGDFSWLFKSEGIEYLQRATDFRSVMGKLVRDHLGATQEQLDRIIPGYADPNQSLKAGGVQAQDKVRVTGEPDIV